MRHLRANQRDFIESIAEDEPVFELRARDPDAAQTLRVYAAYKHNRGASPASIRSLQWFADQMERYLQSAGEVEDTDEHNLSAPQDVKHPSGTFPREMFGAVTPRPPGQRNDDVAR
jgi:hypothetical protein